MKSIEIPSGAIWCHPRMYPKTSEPNVRRCNDRPLKFHPSFAETPPLIAGHSLSAWKARLHTPWSEMPHERNSKDISYHSLHLITIHYINVQTYMRSEQVLESTKPPARRAFRFPLEYITAACDCFDLFWSAGKRCTYVGLVQFLDLPKKEHKIEKAGNARHNIS